MVQIVPSLIRHVVGKRILDMTTTTADTATAAPTGFTRLRTYNLLMGFLHLAQGILVLVLANDFSLPVIATYMDGPPGAAPPSIEPLFDVSIAWGVAIFLFMSAVAHFAIVSPGIYQWYERNLAEKRNYARWIEYSFSSSAL